MIGCEIKGITLKSRVEYVSSKYGAGSLDSVFKALEPKWGNVLQGKVLATRWYPLEVQLDFDEAVRKLLAKGDEGIYEKMGAFSADLQFSEKYAGFVRKDNPHNVLRKSTFAFNRFFRPGKALYEELGPGEARISLLDHHSTPNNCKTNMGFWKRAVELSGGTKVRIQEEICTGRGDEICRFIISWK